MSEIKDRHTVTLTGTINNGKTEHQIILPFIPDEMIVKHVISDSNDNSIKLLYCEQAQAIIAMLWSELSVTPNTHFKLGKTVSGNNWNFDVRNLNNNNEVDTAYTCNYAIQIEFVKY